MISTETSALRFALRATDRGARRAFRKILRRANKSRESAGGHDGRRAQIDLRIGIAHAAFEVSVRGADRDFAFA